MASIWDYVPGLDIGLPLPPGLKDRWIDQDGSVRVYESLSRVDMTLCKRRKLNPKYENVYLEKDGSIHADIAWIVAAQRIWRHHAYRPGGLMYNKIKSRY